jgi:hypothetical protein
MGRTFMLIKIIVADVAPATLVAVKPYWLILWIVMRSSGTTLPHTRQDWQNFFSVGVFGLVIPFLLISWGQRLGPSSTTAILGATTPLLTALHQYLYTQRRQNHHQNDIVDLADTWLCGRAHRHRDYHCQHWQLGCVNCVCWVRRSVMPFRHSTVGASLLAWRPSYRPRDKCWRAPHCSSYCACLGRRSDGVAIDQVYHCAGDTGGGVYCCSLCHAAPPHQ